MRSSTAAKLHPRTTLKVVRPPEPEPPSYGMTLGVAGFMLIAAVTLAVVAWRW